MAGLFYKIFGVVPVVWVSAAILSSSCMPTSSRQSVRSHDRDQIIVTNEAAACTVAVSLRFPTNSIKVCRRDECIFVPLETGESAIEILSAPATNKVFVLLRHKLERLPRPRGVEVVWGYDYSRLIELTLPLQNSTLQNTEVSTLIKMEELDCDGMRSSVSKLVDVSTHGNWLTLKVSVPKKIPDGTEWNIREMRYNVTNRTFVKTKRGAQGQSARKRSTVNSDKL